MFGGRKFGGEYG